MLKIGCVVTEHEKQDGCYECCSQCNYDNHQCPGCGTSLTHDGREAFTTGGGKFHFGCVDEYEEKNNRVTKVNY